jgi:3'-phosphoadenosine 5'-phosphosulfate sulfotransferase (PAPS reductase)/FAD synthetase
MSEAGGNSDKPVRHILSLSGGKDSTALAIYMRDRVPNLEYVFCDTAKELKETYEYLEHLEAYLGKAITVLRNDERAFDSLLEIRRGFLPSPRMRWCTELLKIRPFERYVGDDPVRNYIGIRADEGRKGYISHKPNIQPKYPFIEDGITKEDVMRILQDSGLGLPDYYRWRSRSGCYFCFFQQRIEWVGLLENHPDLFEQAKAYERDDTVTGGKYTWVERESLAELSRPERIAQIRAEHAKRLAEAERWRKNQALADIWDAEEDGSERACLICSL